MFSSPLITIISIFSPLIPVILGYKRRDNLLWIYSLIGLLCNVFLWFQTPSQLFLIKAVTANLFVVTEFILFSTFFFRHFGTSIKIRWLFESVFAILFIALCAYSGYDKFNAIGSAVFCLIYICFSLWGFMSLIKGSNHVHIQRSGFFVVNAAMLIYASSVFFVFLTGFIFQDIKLKLQLWHWVVEPMNAFKYLLIGISLTLKDP